MQEKCVICGELFTPCLKDFDSVLGNWRVRCCKIECGQLYYQKIMESRNPKETAVELKNRFKHQEILEETEIKSDRKRRS